MGLVEQESAYWLAWAQIPGVGPVLLKRIWQFFGSLEQAWQAPLGELAQIEGVGPKLLETIGQRQQTTDIAQGYQTHCTKNSYFWTVPDPLYPCLLREIPDPPPFLYYSGDINPRENQGQITAVAIVGTRDPSDYAKRWTRKLARTLGEHGFLVVSGLAAGIDTEAHRGCLEGGGRTMAVLGTGVDLIYPPQNRHLYGEICQNGAIVSEYVAGTPADRPNFPRRNRIIAGLCRATLIMEAPSKSGSLITARIAAEYGRDVYVLPGSLDNPRAMGCLGLVNRGAQIILGAGHLLELLGQTPTMDLPPRQERPPLPAELNCLLEAIAHLSLNTNQPAVAFDLIVQETHLSAAAVSSGLLQLELMGLVSPEPGMRYQSLC